MSLAILDSPPAPIQRRTAPASRPDLSYAHAARTRAGKALIRLTENATGRRALLRRAEACLDEAAAGRDLWRAMMEGFGLRLDVLSGSLGAIPGQGPLVVVANHPFGLLDGLVLGHVLSALRGGEFRLMAHAALGQAEALRRHLLPIDFAGTEAAQAANLRTRAEAVAYLRRGGAVGVFPGGTVSTGATPLAPPMDPVWRGFTARMVERSGATVVPIWFDGQNSRLFQLASHLHPALRLALLIHEFRRRVDTPVRLAIGAPIPAEALRAHAGIGKQMMDFLRRTTYDLSPKPLDTALLGFEFEAHHRR